MATADPANIHVGDIGTQLIALLKEGTADLDPTDATKKRFFIQRKTKTNILEVEPEVWTDPLDNKKKLRYLTLEGDLSVAGDYILQALVVTADGRWHTNTFTFTVAANIKDLPADEEPEPPAP